MKMGYHTARFCAWVGILWLTLVACGAYEVFFGPAQRGVPPTATAIPVFDSIPVAGTAQIPERLVPTVATVSKITHAVPESTFLSLDEEVTLYGTTIATGLWEPRQRIGVGVPYPPMEYYTMERLGIGWYHAWRVLEDMPSLPGVETWQMVRVSESGFIPSRDVIVAAARAHPGATWLIGNEPDVIWQDNVTPTRYVQLYHEIYHLLKEADPTCHVAAGGIAQPTPLRLRYLEQVLQAYQDAYGVPMPVEMWHIHNFILREERGSWGVDIPSGIEADEGMLFEVQDSDNLAIFREQIIAFRRWMSERGEQGKPLIVSEYGIPMPVEYGFDPERVRRFMITTMDFLLTAADPQLGYTSDAYRLVQRWAWFSMGDTRYPTGNLTDPKTGELTSLGEALGDYVHSLP
ncbi:MAG: hypothetical protein ACUVSF_06885 [Anaerolineae bacterium]